MNLDKHRESLAKYCYDMSKIVFAVAVLSPMATKGPAFLEQGLGVAATVLFLGLALLLEKDITT